MSNKLKAKRSGVPDVVKEMKARFGSIPRGQEEVFQMFFFPIESNALKVHRHNRQANSNAFRKALLLCLRYVRFRIGRGENPDLSTESEAVQALVHAVLYAFDPYTCEEMKQMGLEGIDMTNENTADRYYEIPVRCMIRLLESVDTWQKILGPDGYFKTIEETYGSAVERDLKMHFILAAPL